MKGIIVGCSASVELAKKIARKKRWKFSRLDTKKFPDGETNLRFTDNVKGKEVYLVQSLYDPNDKLIEILFAAHTAKSLRAKKVFLIAPYLSYMRQDKRFRPYEGISSRVMASMMNRCLDGIITVDPHLHRYKSLKDIFTIKAKKLTANDMIARFIKKNIKNPIIIGPDAESFQWAMNIAKKVGCGSTVLKKKRYTSKHVAIKIKEKLDLRNKSVVIVDDVISTGHTMVEVVKDVKKLGAKRIYCICVHPLFVGKSYGVLRKLGAKVISCNTIPHKSNRIEIADIINEGL